MYCPSCSQQIPSIELRFCPRCGFPLSGVVDLVAMDGRTEPVKRSTGLQILRRKEYRLGAKLMFFSFIAFPLTLILSIIFDSPGPLALPVMIFIAGFARLAYSFLFGKEGSPTDEEFRRQFAYYDHAALHGPRAYMSPIDTHRPITTSELGEPPSVTEGTTTLLKDEQ